MTMAISKAVEEGAKAVVCASTGNTSASAAAFSARAGLTCAVLIPEGHIALGKLAQALIHGAKVLQLRGNFDQALDDRPRPRRARRRSRWSTRSTRTASRGRSRAPSRSSTSWATPPTSTASRWATPATSPPTGRATSSTRRRAGRPGCPGCSGFQAAGAAPIVAGHPSSTPRRWPPPSGSATRPAGTARPRRRRESGGGIAAVTDDEILEAYRFLATEESVFCEPASAASVAGLLNARPARRRRPGVHRGLRADRPRAEGPRHRHQPDHACPRWSTPTSAPSWHELGSSEGRADRRPAARPAGMVAAVPAGTCMLGAPSLPQSARSGLRAGPPGSMPSTSPCPASGGVASGIRPGFPPPHPLISLAVGFLPPANEDMLKRGSR